MKPLLLFVNSWVGYDDINFSGKQTLFLQGQHKYEKMSPGFGEFKKDSLSSLRALQIVCYLLNLFTNLS